jgi:hypothetical protein
VGVLNSEFWNLECVQFNLAYSSCPLRIDTCIYRCKFLLAWIPFFGILSVPDGTSIVITTRKNLLVMFGNGGWLCSRGMPLICN